MKDIDDEDALDDVLNDDSQFSYVINKWFNESDESPLKCRKNIINNYRTEGGRIIYEYERKDDDISTLFVSTKAIKSCPFKFAGVELLTEDEKKETDEDGDVLNEKLEDALEAQKTDVLGSHKSNAVRAFKDICIYGHYLDVDDRFGTRFDLEFVNRIARDFETKFENVTIHGAFGSVGDLMDVINAIYDNICTKGMMSRVRVHLDSRIKDDDGNVKTLANMIANAYVTPNIVERDNITDIIYTKFDKNMTANFYTD